MTGAYPAALVLALILALPAAGAVPSLPGIPGLPPHHFREGNNTTANETSTTSVTVSITSHKNNEIVKARDVRLEGRADGDGGIRLVEVSQNCGTWMPASGQNPWVLRLKLEDGSNTIAVRATNQYNCTAEMTISIVYSAGVKDNTGILLAAAILLPIIALIVLAATRKRRAPVEEEKGDGAPPKRPAKAAGTDKDEGELADDEEVTRLDKPVAKKKTVEGTKKKAR